MKINKKKIKVYDGRNPSFHLFPDDAKLPYGLYKVTLGMPPFCQFETWVIRPHGFGYRVYHHDVLVGTLSKYVKRIYDMRLIKEYV